MAAGVCGTKPLVFRLHKGAPELVREVLLERGWEEYDEQEQEEGDWNLYWRASAFRNSDYENILPWQRLNHHPKTVGITRKDCLARNLRRMRGTYGSALYNFSPTAFILPNDYTRFLQEYTKNRFANGGSPGYWICKPVDLSRGRGIFVFEDIKDLAYDSPVIVQRYISNPLLVSGYKFDLRIYVCVKSFCPLTIYMHQEGLVRFATEKFNLASLDNLYSHLTNTSINKFGPFYTTDKERVGQGCKWTMSKFCCFLHSQGVNELLLWQKINSIVTLTLLTIAPSIPSSPNCLELFGFDILIDDRYKPWLLEVNYSPALSLDCPADVTVKKGLINDLIDLMNYKKIDSLRQRGYLRQRYKRPCYLGSQSVKPNSPPMLLLPKSMCELPSDKRSRNQSRIHSLHSDNAGYLLVEMNEIRSARSNTTNYAPRPLLNPNSKAALGNKKACPLLPRKAEPFQWSEITDLEPELENRELSTHDSPRQPLRHSSESALKLPSIHIHKYKPHTFPWDHSTQDSSTPFRVGEFILTFPFNEVTLKASQDKLNVKTAVQEVHRLINRLAHFCSHEEKTRKEDSQNSCVVKEKFRLQFWGPRNPPLLSECCSST